MLCYLIGEGGANSGKTDLVNTLFNLPILRKENRPDCNGPFNLVNGNKNEAQTLCHFGKKTEGGVTLNISVTEIVNFTSAAKLSSKEYFSSIMDIIQKPLQGAFKEETSPLRKAGDRFNDLFDAILYLIPHTHIDFTDSEIELFAELRQMSLLIPIISKADMYTTDELFMMKNKVSKQLALCGLDRCLKLNRGFRDDWIQESLDYISVYSKRADQKRWPMAIIGAKPTAEDGNTIRERKYPWGCVDIDDEANSDLFALQSVLIRSFFHLNKIYLKNILYELIWRPFFMTGVKGLLEPPAAVNAEPIGRSLQEGSYHDPSEGVRSGEISSNPISTSMDEVNGKMASVSSLRQVWESRSVSVEKLPLQEL